MKILIFGTIYYKEEMKKHRDRLIAQGHEVQLPILDTYEGIHSALAVIEINIEKIKWADECHMFWDHRSIGTVADWQTAVALGKPVIPIYIEKTFIYRNAMEAYFLKNKEK